MSCLPECYTLLIKHISLADLLAYTAAPMEVRAHLNPIKRGTLLDPATTSTSPVVQFPAHTWRQQRIPARRHMEVVARHTTPTTNGNTTTLQVVVKRLVFVFETGGIGRFA